MKSFLFTLGQDDPAQAVGAMIAGSLDVPAAYRKLLRKGATLTEDIVEPLRNLALEQPGLRLSLLRIEQGDIDENEAALRLGNAVAGSGVEVKGPAQGRTRLVARHNGLLVLDSARLTAINSVPDVSIYTLFGYTPVAQGTTVAEAKITPLATSADHVEKAEQLAQGATVVIEVLPFAPRKAGLLVRERLDGAAAEKVVATLGQKLAWFGSALLPGAIIDAPPDANKVAQDLESLLAQGADLLLTAGGSASDPHDATIEALTLIGAEAPQIGVPTHPGSLLWIAWKGEIPIIGIPSCGAFSEHTSFDIVLPRLLAFGRAAMADLPSLSEGGLLTHGMEHRFPPYSDSKPNSD